MNTSSIQNPLVIAVAGGFVFCVVTPAVRNEVFSCANKAIEYLAHPKIPAAITALSSGGSYVVFCLINQKLSTKELNSLELTTNDVAKKLLVVTGCCATFTACSNYLQSNEQVQQCLADIKENVPTYLEWLLTKPENEEDDASSVDSQEIQEQRASQTSLMGLGVAGAFFSLIGFIALSSLKRPAK